ncbi:heavy metal-associated domain-containing protein [Hyaloraphidium curvatum]|nr:heavy metal-associated domain-containing protein [Hyaloraphidium curvatum]
MSEGPQVYEFNVTMTCGGCSGAVNRALKRTEGVQEVDISMEAQRVKVTTDERLTEDAVFEVIKKTGKAVTKISPSA